MHVETREATTCQCLAPRLLLLQVGFDQRTFSEGGLEGHGRPTITNICCLCEPQSAFILALNPSLRKELLAISDPAKSAC